MRALRLENIESQRSNITVELGGAIWKFMDPSPSTLALILFYIESRLLEWKLDLY